MNRDLKPCGTPAAYRRHVYHRQTPCEPCYAAQLSYFRVRRAIRRGRPPQIALLDEVVAVLAGAMAVHDRRPGGLSGPRSS